jgi:hypothetical protein
MITAKINEFEAFVLVAMRTRFKNCQVTIQTRDGVPVRIVEAFRTMIKDDIPQDEVKRILTGSQK